MNAKEFMGRLERLKAYGYTAILTFSSGEIRIRRKGSRRIFCPLTAVCYYETGKFFHISETHEVVNVLNINEGTKETIIWAADNKIDYKNAARRMRSKMLKVLELPYDSR